MLLSDGHLMFYGGASVALAWFKQLGQPCPYGVNVADHILDLACGDPPDLVDAREGAGAEVRAQLVEAYETRTVGECVYGGGGTGYLTCHHQVPCVEVTCLHQVPCVEVTCLQSILSWGVESN